MNMISTGAFLNEMDASNKQPTVAEKFAAVWEKKNAKAARAGGVSLMALSLAACGSSSTTTTTSTDTSTDTTTTTPVAGLAFALTSSADVIGPNSATTATKSSANDDTFRGADSGTLTSNDIIDGGDGSDTLTATIDEASGATVTVKPALTSVETINVTIGETHSNDNDVTLDLGSSTGVTAINITLEDDVSAVLSNAVVSQAVSVAKGGATADATVTYKSLSTATDGGADAATISAADIDVASLTVAGVETITLNVSGKAGDIDVLTAAALEKLIITGGVADADSTTETFAVGTAGAADDAIEFNGLDTGETGSIDASGSTGDITLVLDDSFDFTATGGEGKLTISNTSAGSTNGAVTGTAAVTVTAGTGGVDATLEGGANASSATAMTLVTVTGSAVADTVNIAGVVDPTNITATTGVDESKTANAIVTTGAGDDAITIDAGVVSIDAGTGDDTLTVTTWGSVTTADSINLGEGEDTVVTSEATLGASQKATMAMFVGAEVIKTSATGTKSIDLSALGTASSAVALAHTAPSAATGNDGSGGASTAGLAALTFTSANSASRLTVSDLTGQAGSANTGKLALDVGGTGGTGLDINAKLDTGNNEVTVVLEDNADIKGGVGGAAKNDATNVTIGGAGGIGLDANEYEVLNLVLAAKDTTKDTVTITGAAGGVGDSGTSSDAGAGGADIIVGANATINITETLAAKSGTTALTIKDHISSIDLNDITGTNVTVNAATLNGAVTIDSVQGNTVITTGAGNDTILAGTGVDTISTGAGDDSINGQAGADVINIGTGQDIVIIESTESTEAATDVITGFSTASASWTGSAANDIATEVIGTDVAGAEADVLDFDTHAVGSSVMSVEADATGTANLVSSIAGISAGTVTANVANGILTVAGANAADVNTLAEWVDVAGAIAATEDEVLAFEFDGSTYVYSDNGGATDFLVKLDGLTGVSGLDVTAATGTVGGEGYIIIA